MKVVPIWHTLTLLRGFVAALVNATDIKYKLAEGDVAMRGLRTFAKGPSAFAMGLGMVAGLMFASAITAEAQRDP